jgi:hypothetical protein
MADTLKEIYAGTLTVSDIASTGSVTLATTDANTQYVIKDVSVSGTFGTGSTPILKINDYPVADLSASASGTEIVDVSSTVKYQAFSSAPALTQTTQKLISYVGTAPSFQDRVSYNINGVAASSSGSATALGTALTNYAQTHNYGTANDGSLFYVYWNGDNGSSLYKRTGGVNGTETTIQTNSYGWFAFNGVDTYYIATNGSATLSKYDINTGNTTTIGTGQLLSNTSYPSASVMNNGNILVNYSGNGQTTSLTIVNPTTGANTTVSGLTDVSVSGTNYKITGYYDSVTGRYTFYRRFNGTLYKHALNGTVTLGSAYGGGVTNTSYTISTGVGGATSGFNTGYVSVDSTNYTMAQHGVAGKTDLATYNTSTSSLTTGITWLPYRTDSDSIIKNITASVSASSFTDTVKVRVTGVKSTI